MNTQPEFSGFKGRFFAWFLTSPLRRVLEWKMGNPDPRFMDLLELEGHETVVDSGCGSGHHTLMVAERLPRGRVVGVDVSREMIDKLNRNARGRGLQARVEAIEADALAIPLDDGIADRAITVAAWHHLDDPQAACSELARVLRPGGRLVAVDLEISAHHQPGKHLEGHDRTFGEPDMRRFLQTAGLRDVHIETIGRWVIGSARK
jgi:ubiquinone/menaquinone biosynthesis C-methylase UbiE